MLTCTAVGDIRKTLVTAAGTIWEVDRGRLPPLYTQYVRQNLTGHMSPAMMQEAVTIAHALDGMLQGYAASSCDILSQRLKSLESTAKGAHWTVGRQLELVRSEGATMTDEAETMEAYRRAKEEDRLKTLVGKGQGGKGGESYGTPKGKKGKDSKGSRGKGDDHGKGKNQEGKKDDKGGWQNQRK